MSGISALDKDSAHRITSGQVVVDLQTAVKELVENSLDAGATAIDVRFQHYGLKTIDVVDNGCGIAARDHDTIALKHYTSKLATFEDLSRVLSFGFRGEALSSLCALTDSFTVTTATASEAPMGTVIEMDRTGQARSKCKIARQRGTTVSVSNLFQPLPVRRKELERNAKREFQKALNLLHAYALVPCALENNGVRMSVSNQTEGGRKVIQFKTDGTPFVRASVLAVWGPKALENIVDLDLSFNVETEKSVQRRLDPEKDISVVIPVKVQGLISKFSVGAGRASVDRQFFFVNGRPYNPGKVQKAINEVYRTFNANQSPFVIANIIVPTNACDINISPDKRTIFIHSENNFVQALKTELENEFSSARSTFDVSTQQTQASQQTLQHAKSQGKPWERDMRRISAAKDHTQPGRSPSPPPEPGNTDATSAKDPMGAPHLLLDGDVNGGSSSETEPEPEPTLVAQPAPSRKRGVEGAAMVDRPRSRAPSEPLFFPDSDEEDGKGTTGADKGKQKERVENGDDRASPLQVTRDVPSATTPSIPSIHLARPSTDAPSKPRSVQTVLSTRGAAWNLRRDGDGDVGGGRERKRARLSSEGDRARETKKSFRSSLSQFLSSGKKALPDEEEESESEKDKRDRDVQKGRGSSEEVDELDDEDEGEERERLGGGSKLGPRPGSQSPQETVVVPSDDERMDVDEPPSAKGPHRAGSPVPQTSAGQSDDVETLSEDDWGISPTLVGTLVPPADKATPTQPSPTSRPTDTDAVTLRVNLINIGTHYLDIYARLSSSPSSSSPAVPSSTLRSAVTSANLDTAAEDAIASAALSRIISKADFERMAIVGQFNLGFIVVRKRGEPASDAGMDDLFIVDQHAADEKWNFETLQESTVIASQKLFRPRELSLTAADEILAIENMDVLKRNGFELERAEPNDEDGQTSESENARARLRLVAQPMSKETVFDTKDLEELIHLMQDRPRGTMVRCSKARAMFAMRACRRSVMIGKALDRPRMTAIVRHMGTMDQPWNCPHGRPTMRHLSDLRAFGRYVPTRRAIDWEGYGGEMVM